MLYAERIGAFAMIRLLLCAAVALAAVAGEDSARDRASLVGQRFRAERDVVYKTIGGFEARLDLYMPYDNKPGPTVRRKDASALLWLRGLEDPRGIARRLSPLTYVRPDLPPILTIHGDADEMVPYSDATRLRRALDQARVPNQLLTVPGGHHGRFRWTDADTIKVQRTIEAFLRKYHQVIP